MTILRSSIMSFGSLTQHIGRRLPRDVGAVRLPPRRPLFTSFRARCIHTNQSAQSARIRNTKIKSSNTFANLGVRQSRQQSSNSGPKLDVTSSLGSPPNQTLSQRLKALSKEYGWTAVGVYLALSALDFPFCYLAVQLLGPERVGKAEHAIVDFVRSMVQIPLPDLMQKQEEVDASRRAAAAEKGSKATVWTQLVLAYAVHKSLIFFRVPLTAAVLPKVVKTLRSYGWKVGNRPSRAALGATTSTSKA